MNAINSAFKLIITGQQFRHLMNRSPSSSLRSNRSTKVIRTPSKSHSSSSKRQTPQNRPTPEPLIKMRVVPIPALQDNYMYLLIDDQTKEAAAIDPVNACDMINAISFNNVTLKAILTTHHHYDHANGNADMQGMYPEASVYGGDMRIQSISKQVEHGEKIKLGNLKIECLATPCHTRGHFCYYVTTGDNENNQDRVVFTGDTLFIAGCGRFFEGSAIQMDSSLNNVLAKLPPDTKIYCGHEYTVNNLRFALLVEPHNPDIKEKLAWAQMKVSKGEPTVPSTIADEKKTNPFMRLENASVKRFTGETERLEVMSVLRQKKNEF